MCGLCKKIKIILEVKDKHCLGTVGHSLNRCRRSDWIHHQFNSVTQFCLTLRPHEPQHARPPCPSPTPRVHPNPCPSSQWCHPTISSCHPLLLLPSVFLSIRVFSNESAVCIRWSIYWSFSFNLSPFNEHPGLISFRMDWLDLLAVLGTLKSLLQHHSSKSSILRHSAFFTVYIHTWPLVVWSCMVMYGHPYKP